MSAIIFVTQTQQALAPQHSHSPSGKGNQLVSFDILKIKGDTEFSPLTRSLTCGENFSRVAFFDKNKLLFTVFLFNLHLLFISCHFLRSKWLKWIIYLVLVCKWQGESNNQLRHFIFFYLSSSNLFYGDIPGLAAMDNGWLPLMWLDGLFIITTYSLYGGRTPDVWTMLILVKFEQRKGIIKLPSKMYLEFHRWSDSHNIPGRSKL